MRGLPLGSGEIMPIEYKPDGIEEYAAAHSTPLPRLLEELSKATQERTGALAGMLSGQLVGLLLQTLVVATRARRVLEVGMFTGFSAQMMAAALPDDGRIITCDVSEKAIGIAKEFYARSPHGHKIEVREGPALDTMMTLEGPFELIFIDADKGNYVNYYETALPLLAPAGIIAVDNVLWSGRVLDPKEPDDHAIVAFNQHVAADARTANVILTVRDGVMLVRHA
jgi:caffeoyl-CoA O-methyltransferase